MILLGKPSSKVGFSNFLLKSNEEIRGYCSASLIRVFIWAFILKCFSFIYRSLEANQFTGEVPDELGKLVNLQTL